MWRAEKNNPLHGLGDGAPVLSAEALSASDELFYNKTTHAVRDEDERTATESRIFLGRQLEREIGRADVNGHAFVGKPMALQFFQKDSFPWGNQIHI